MQGARWKAEEPRWIEDLFDRLDVLVDEEMFVWDAATDFLHSYYLSTGKELLPEEPEGFWE